MRAAMCSRSANPAGAVCRTADLTPLGARPAACQLRSATRQGPLPRAASRQQVPRRRPGLQVSAIGFDLPGAESNNKSAEKHAEELTRAAASLLLYSNLLKGKPAQAFLGILQLLQKGNPLLLVQQYGELYRLLVAEDCASWQDYLLDQVIRGTENPLAKAAAAGKPTAHLRRAAAHDLDQLQRLAVGERTLAGWIKDTVYGGASEEWLEAASSLAPQEQHGAGQEPQAVHEALLRPAAPPPQLLAPLTEAQRAGLRAELAGKWKWSEGVDLLVRYHAAHGGGLVSAHSVLAWTGKLQAQDVLKGAHELTAAEEGGLVGSHHHAASTLMTALTEFLQQDLGQASSPPHVAVCGSATDRWLYAAWALQRLEGAVPADLQPAAAGLRTLVLPANQLSSLADLAWSLSQHPRTRFAVVANGMEACGSVGDVAAMLSGFDGFSWPPNALLLAGFPSAPPAELAPVFKHVATVEDRFAA